MDARVLAWARRVKGCGRQVSAGTPPGAAPSLSSSVPLWLFTDAFRLTDPIPSIRHLPRGLAGVVLRHDHVAGRLALARRVARLCRARDLTLSVAGDGRLAAQLGAGLHLRGGRLPSGKLAARHKLTGSAHSLAEIKRCRCAGVAVIFLSPVFATESHPGRGGLGPLRWAAWARFAGPGAAALGGIDGQAIRRLPRQCRAVGAIAALRKG